VVGHLAGALFPALIGTAALKLLFEASLFGHLRSKQHTPLKRSAQLMTGDLSRAVKWRFSLGIIGGVLLPGMWLWLGGGPVSTGIALPAVVAGQFFALLAGELLERYLFFTAAVASRMPGGLRT
jgi:hypothetical protein